MSFSRPGLCRCRLRMATERPESPYKFSPVKAGFNAGQAVLLPSQGGSTTAPHQPWWAAPVALEGSEGEHRAACEQGSRLHLRPRLARRGKPSGSERAGGGGAPCSWTICTCRSIASSLSERISASFSCDSSFMERISRLASAVRLNATAMTSLLLAIPGAATAPTVRPTSHGWTSQNGRVLVTSESSRGTYVGAVDWAQ
jgi:hypothetical protein